jgi:cystathionine gamma-synthase
MPNAVRPVVLTRFTQAVSVSLPTWSANVAYEEGEDWVITKMETGYPRYARCLPKHTADSQSDSLFT